MMPASRHVRVPACGYCLDFYCRQAAAIERIRAYAGNPAAFARASEPEAYFRTIQKPFSPRTAVERTWPTKKR